MGFVKDMGWGDCGGQVCVLIFRYQSLGELGDFFIFCGSLDTKNVRLLFCQEVYGGEGILGEFYRGCDFFG